MASSWSRGLQFFGAVALMAAAAGAGCGGGGHNNSFSSGDDGGSSSDSSLGDDSGDGSNLLGNNPTLSSLSISPAQAAITSLNGATAKQAFVVTAHYADGTSSTLTSGLTWGADAPPVGMVSGSGLFTANGSLGGLVHVTANYKTQKATAVLNVKLLLQQNTANVPPSVQTSLQGATTPDPTVVWAYPYNGTVWARGLLPPTLQWNGGAATDFYYVHIVSSTFELQQFTTATGAPSSQVLLGTMNWDQFTNSTSGSTTVTVARWDGTAATVIANHKWTIAPASIRGTVYYWSNNLGRVLRIQPGAMAPDDFANQPPLSALAGNSSCLMTCHTVSADGSTIVSGGGAYGGSYDLKTGMPMNSLGGTWGPTGGGASSSSVVRWMMPAVSPDGKYILLNSMAEGLAYANDTTYPTGFLGLYTTANGMAVATSGVQNVPLAQPAWSPEGSRVVYVDAGDPLTVPWYGSWNNPPPGDLKVMSFNGTANPMFGAPSTLVATGGDPTKRIAFPTVTPDGKWVLYSRVAGADTRLGNGDLYFASAITPNQEVRLAQVDGDGYPFAAGTRDLSWNFEPAFAPVASGGYFWVVFTSRRTYGNTLTGQAEPCAQASPTCASDPNCATDCATICACTTATEVKQLWVVAIDQNPKPGVDPSHPAFHLQGQDESNLAMRGFMSLPPCALNGRGCTSGTDCCGGYCSAPGDGGATVCQSMPSGCSQDGDKCNVTSDCCSASVGVTCINHVCSEPTPQ